MVCMPVRPASFRCSLPVGRLAAAPCGFPAVQKFILTALLLALACGFSGAAAARTPRHTYMQVRRAEPSVAAVLIPPEILHFISCAIICSSAACYRILADFEHKLTCCALQITFCVIVTAVALVGYTQNAVLWSQARSGPQGGGGQTARCPPGWLPWFASPQSSLAAAPVPSSAAVVRATDQHPSLPCCRACGERPLQGLASSSTAWRLHWSSQ